MSILYYFKPPQWIPAVEIIYEKTKVSISKGKKIRKKKVSVPQRNDIFEKDLVEIEDLAILSLMLDGAL